MPRRTAAIAVGVATAAVTAVGLSFFRVGKPLLIVSTAVAGVAGVAVSARREGEENDVNAYIKSGNAKYGIGDYQGSIEDFSKALIIDPKYADDDRRLITTIFDPHEGADYLTWKRKKK